MGWGANDAGGSSDYAGRGIYNYMPKYTTATISKNNQVTANFEHDMMLQLGDGACVYTLGALPGMVISEGYCKGNNGQSDYYGYAADEGSRYVTISKNVYDAWSSWSSQSSAANTSDLTVTNNWYNQGTGITDGQQNAKVSGNVSVSGTAWPADAQAIIKAAGLEPAYADLKTNP